LPIKRLKKGSDTKLKKPNSMALGSGTTSERKATIIAYYIDIYTLQGRLEV